MYTNISSLTKTISVLLLEELPPGLLEIFETIRRRLTGSNYELLRPPVRDHQGHIAIVSGQRQD